MKKFEEDLEKLCMRGRLLQNSFSHLHDRERFEEAVRTQLGAEADAFLAKVEPFVKGYQAWYSEALALLRQLLPDRVADFVQHYEAPKNRKEISFSNYRLQDSLQGIQIRNSFQEKLVGPSSAQVHLEQQVAILEAAKGRFASSLFDIRHMVQADLLDSEIEAAEQLAKYNFVRAAGAVAGVVLERHLGQVCTDRSLKTGKKNPTISDFNELLKANDVIDVPQWRFIQHLADIRNLCDHSKIPEPTAEQVTDLISGVKKVTKTIH